MTENTDHLREAFEKIEREKFEEFAIKRKMSLTRNARKPDEYAFATQKAWEAWMIRAYQAQAGHASVPCPKVPFGSYENTIALPRPRHMYPTVRGDWITVDRCIADEVLELWQRGIWTLESCCGHGRTHGYIAVAAVDAADMEMLGYEFDSGAGCPSAFIPKTECSTRTSAPSDDEESLTIADYEEVLADKRRLTRLLDIALCGEENAAKQASLCDLIPIAKKLREDRDELLAVRTTAEVKQQWKPIAEAPRDGSLFDVFFGDTGERYIGCRWLEKHNAVGKKHGYPEMLTVFKSMPTHFMVIQPPHIVKEGA